MVKVTGNRAVVDGGDTYVFDSENDAIEFKNCCNSSGGIVSRCAIEWRGKIINRQEKKINRGFEL